jgi:hypothetical protein
MITFPTRARGRQSAEAAEAYETDLVAFARQIEQIQSESLEFTVSSRGWCYILEEHGLGKGDFDRAQRLINDCRKSGLLPLDICAVDEAREAEIPSDHSDQGTADQHARAEFADAEDTYDNALENALWGLRTATYHPHAFWDYQSHYVEMAVEKVDLRSLFKPICERYKIPITNVKGWADLHSRAAMLRRFAEHAAQGRTCVLLYAGDHDPVGLNISECIRSNLRDLNGARFRDGEVIDFDADELIIDRFGLNADFIEEHRLSWIEGLETGSGRDLASPKHPDHYKPHVQTYLQRFGARKVEANALVTRPQAARILCQEAVFRYVDLEAEKRRQAANEAATRELQETLSELAKERGWTL